MEQLDCLKNLILADQNHVFKFVGELDPNQREYLVSDAKCLDVVKLQRIIDKPDFGVPEKSRYELYPVPDSFVEGSGHTSKEQVAQYFDHGLRLISLGKVGVVILAGGQGTRLGLAHPKGLHSIGLNSNKTLLQLHIETLLRLIQLANTKYGTLDASITCFIMTSQSTYTMTIDFLENNDYFGFNKDDVIIFNQSQLPCIDRTTKKIILEEKFKIAFAPTGNGGFWDSLVEHLKIMEAIKQRDIVGLHIYCVDNVLNKGADPCFIGCCDIKGVDCGNKVIERTCADDALGVFCMTNDAIKVVEYSEMKENSACFSQTNEKNELLFKYGNICNHYFTTRFLENIITNCWNDKLPIHYAYKKVPQINLVNGEKAKPSIANAIKLEKFIFDVIPFIKSKNVCLYNVNRTEEFSPLKNATGKDSVESCLIDLLKYHFKLKNPNYSYIPDDLSELKTYEISPLDFYFTDH